MKREEMRDLLTIMRLNYPQSFKTYTREQSEAYLDMMYEAFKDDPTPLVVSAVKTIMYTDVRDFAPNIAQIKAKMHTLTHKDMTAEEAWNLVLSACSNGIYGAEDEFNKLPEDIQSLVGSPSRIREWAKMDADTLDTVVASNWQKSYKIRKEKSKELQMLPSDVKLALEDVASSMKMLGGLDERQDED